MSLRCVSDGEAEDKVYDILDGVCKRDALFKPYHLVQGQTETSAHQHRRVAPSLWSLAAYDAEADAASAAAAAEAKAKELKEVAGSDKRALQQLKKEAQAERSKRRKWQIHAMREVCSHLMI